MRGLLTQTPVAVIKTYTTNAKPPILPTSCAASQFISTKSFLLNTCPILMFNNGKTHVFNDPKYMTNIGGRASLVLPSATMHVVSFMQCQHSSSSSTSHIVRGASPAGNELWVGVHRAFFVKHYHAYLRQLSTALLYHCCPDG
jgi:hypothetical protein